MNSIIEKKQTTVFDFFMYLFKINANEITLFQINFMNTGTIYLLNIASKGVVNMYQKRATRKAIILHKMQWQIYQFLKIIF